jgi:rhodanese-related sulfurtransferase
MGAPSSAIPIETLYRRLGTGDWPVVLDVRREPAFRDSGRMLPGSLRQPAETVGAWPPEPEPGRDIVTVCVHGHEMSQGAAAQLRAGGRAARSLAGGLDAWIAAGLPMIATTARPEGMDARPSRWVTRERPKIDRLACPWLLRRFVEPRAEILYVEADPERVRAVAAACEGIPFDVPGVELSHDGQLCSFDTMLRYFDLHDPALDRLALIVRGADTAQLELAPEAAGLLAVALGVSALHADDDLAALDAGVRVYDAFYAWARFAAEERHNWPAATA